MTARAGHHLTVARVEDLFTDWMREIAMQSVAVVADIVNRAPGHVRMVGSVRRMAVIA